MVPVDPRVSVGHLDKIVHLCEYLLFAWLLVQAARGQTPSGEAAFLRGLTPVWAWIYATSYGLLIELLQGLVPWRSADLGDALANAIGAALGVWLANKSVVRSR